tara:strand:+ start:238 stop:783 length:546 start_codon:yes stop_codon:yes gene_type:complete
MGGDCNIMGAFSSGGGGGGAVWEELANVSAASAASIASGTIDAKKFLDIQVYAHSASGTGQNWQLNFNSDTYNDGNSKYATQETQSASHGTAGRASQPTWYWGVGHTNAVEFYGHTYIVNHTDEMKIGLPMDVTIGFTDATTAPYSQFMRGVWNDTAQITAITASMSTGSADWFMYVMGHD